MKLTKSYLKSLIRECISETFLNEQTKGLKPSKKAEVNKKELKTFQEKAMDDMMESCFAYGGIERDSDNFKQYILPYKEIGKPKI